MKQLVYSLLVLAAMAFTFSSCEDVPMPYGWPNATPETPADNLPQEGEGTFESPYNVAKANAIIASGDYDGDATVYVKGIITQIEDGLPNSYGNATYFISDDAAGTNKLEVYRGYGFGGAKITAADDIKVGDEVIIEGKLINYSGTYEITQGSKIVYQNGKSSIGGGTPEGEGTKENPYNSVAANQLAASLASGANSEEVYIKGKVVSVKEQFGTQYGNATFYISDDGTEEGQFYVFRTLYLGNAKYTEGDLLKVGDEVIICGIITNYMGNTPETVAGNSYLYSLNGKTTTGGGTETGGATGDGSKENPFNSIAATKYAEELGAGNTSEADYYIKGKISNIKFNYDAEHGTATFSISDDGTTENQFLIYGAYYLDNKAYTEGDLLNLGDEVVICGKITNYNGTCETASKKAYLYSWKKGEGGSGESGDTGESQEVKAGDLCSTNATSVGTVTVSGTKFEFDKGTNSSNDPKYYTAGSGTIRMYPGNTVTIDAGSKKIASVTATCDSYNGTDYTAEGKVTCEPGTATLSSLVYTFSGINSSTVKITNTNTGTGGATQFRILSLTITFAK